MPLLPLLPLSPVLPDDSMAAVGAAFMVTKTVEAGLAAPHADYVEAVRLADRCRARLDQLLAETGTDVLIAPAVNGEAPLGLERTGDATFNLLWTFLWMPCVTLPFARGPKGLPVGIQLVGRQHDDVRLLDIAAWAKAALT